MIEINRLLSTGDNISININGQVRTGVVKAVVPNRSITIDCSGNLLQPAPEKYYWVGGVDGWITEAQYARLGQPPA